MSIPTLLRLMALGAFAAAMPNSLFAQDDPIANQKLSRYPLRLHVLALDDTHRTVRLQPNWCAGTVPDLDGAGSAGGANPCSASGSAALGGDDDFSGTGRGDLVTPPQTTQAFSFTYEGCSRVRVPPGFQGLPARWKRPGSKLEVLIPTDALVGADRALPAQKCTLTVVLRDFVYLRLRSGAIIQVSQDAFRAKPSLRVFLSGGPQQLERRSPPVVSIKTLLKPSARRP
jgi:hypothetical protein